jgi:stage IV sporulation protein FB
MLLGSVFTGYLLEAITLFGIVFLHEMGHVVAAKSFGWNVKEVQLLPFGGVAIVEELGGIPANEDLIVALAGPLQHIWMILFAMIMRLLNPENSDWWNYFIEANLMIGLFNLMPVLPLDGGRVLQTVFGYIMPYHRSLFYATILSLVLSISLIGICVFQFITGLLPLNLLVMGLFLCASNWFAYRQLPYHFLRFLINRGERVGRLVMKGTLAQPIVVTGQRSISDILKLFMREKYHLIYVINEKGRIQAVLPEQQLVNSYLDGQKPGSAVSELFM